MIQLQELPPHAQLESTIRKMEKRTPPSIPSPNYRRETRSVQFVMDLCLFKLFVNKGVVFILKDEMIFKLPIAAPIFDSTHRF